MKRKSGPPTAGSGSAKVATDAGDGYVSTSFLKMEETSSRESAPDQAESDSSSTAETEEEKPAPEDNTEETPAEQNPEGTGTATVRTSNGRLRVRKGPGPDHEILTYLYNGNTVTVLSVEGDWAKVSTDAGEGYVSAEYLEMNDTAAAESVPDQEKPPPKRNPRRKRKPQPRPGPQPAVRRLL